MKKFSIIFVSLIIASGIFKNYISLFFSAILDYALFSAIGISTDCVESKLLFITHDGKIDHGLGIFGYYASYLFLHFCLINSLFYDNRKLRSTLSIGLLCLLLGLAFLTILFKLLELKIFAEVSLELFNEMVGRPLILFLVEGGGAIYNYIDKLVK